MTNRPLDYMGRSAYGRLQSIANPEAGAIWRTRFDEPDPVELDLCGDTYTVDDTFDDLADYARRLWPLIVEAVPPRDLELLVMHCVDDAPIRELAERDAISHARVHTLIGRAVRTVKKLVFSKALGNLPPPLATPQRYWSIKWARQHADRMALG